MGHTGLSRINLNHPCSSLTYKARAGVSMVHRAYDYSHGKQIALPGVRSSRTLVTFRSTSLSSAAAALRALALGGLGWEDGQRNPEAITTATVLLFRRRLCTWEHFKSSGTSL